MTAPASIRVLASASLLLATLAAGAGAQNSQWRVGQRAPDVRLPTIDGERTIDLREFRGTKLLLIEFASW